MRSKKRGGLLKNKYKLFLKNVDINIAHFGVPYHGLCSITRNTEKHCIKLNTSFLKMEVNVTLLKFYSYDILKCA